MRTFHLTAILLLAAALSAGGLYASLDLAAPASSSLAIDAPVGALLAIESPDFAALLRSWNNSPEQRRWLAGDNYAAFSRSRLFGRLGDAQSEFAAAAGLTPDSRFLQQIAGSQSLFAWYDIGNLEFLYITRLSHEQVAQMPLLALHDKFEQRQAGGVTFYVRSSEDANATTAAPSSPDTGDNPRPRTVAFAIRGDMLLLSTREDLIAAALEQMAHPGGRSLATDPWYVASLAATNEKPGDLRLTMDLAKIARSPYFRTYWVQQNITDTQRYTAALSDLYRESGTFREERFLLLASAAQTSEDMELTSLLHFLPPGAVYRAVAHPPADQTLAEIEDKLLARSSASMQIPHQAPSAELAVPTSGDPSDLDNRIDAINAPSDPRAAALDALQSLLRMNTPVAMLSLSSAVKLNTSSTKELPPDQGNIFSAIHTGVVLEMTTACDTSAWQHALTAALSPRISVGAAGLRWTEQSNEKLPWSQLDGPFPLAFAAKGNTCVLASDPGTLLAMLSANETPAEQHAPAISIAGFSHASQRDSLLKLVALLDRKSSSNPEGQNGRPLFFSGNMASLSSTFEDLDSETFTESQPSPTLIRQTVRYTSHQH